MNKLKGRITVIESTPNISIVDVEHKGDYFSALMLETPGSSDYLRVGEPVMLIFKETEVSIAKDLSGLISLRNRIKSRIIKINSDKVLTCVVFDYKGEQVVSIITTRSALRLGLKEGDEAEWLVKANEISLMRG